MARNAKTEYEAKFRQCLQNFTLQKPDEILPKWQGKFLQESCSDPDRLHINEEHPVWKRKDLALWGLEIIAEVFIREYPMLHTSEDFVQLTTELAEQQLMKEIQAQVGCLDLSLITELSAEKYEGKASDAFKLLLVPYPLEPEKIRRITLFDRSMWLQLRYENIHALRKQLNMAKKACLVACCIADGSTKDFYTVGLGKEKMASAFPSIQFTGNLSWSFCLPNIIYEQFEDKKFCHLRYERGRLLLPDFNLETAEQWKIKQLPCIDVKEEEVNCLKELLQSAKRQDQGTILIVSDERTIKAECDQLCKAYNRGIILKEPQSLLGDDTLLLQLSSIDGALLVDLEAKCWACGVILDGNAIVRGDMARGSRFNSTNNYIHNLLGIYPNSPLLAIVVSEDGMVDLLYPDEKNLIKTKRI